MSGESSADYVAYTPEPAPPSPNPDYLPAPGEARDRVFSSHSARIAEWSGYLENYNRSFEARRAQTSKLVAAKRANRTR